MILNKGIPTKRRITESSVQQELELQLTALAERFYNARSNTFDYNQCRNSQNFFHAILAARRLQFFDANTLQTDAQKQAFWLNVYNLLLIHIVCQHEVVNSIRDLKGCFQDFRYQVGQHLVSLDDIEHGILRANRRAPGTLRAPFDSKDPKNQLCVKTVDPRIHAALYSASRSSAPLRCFSAANLEQELQRAAGDFLARWASFNAKTRQLTLPKTLHWYRKDFASYDTNGQGRALVNFLTRWLPDHTQRNAILAEPSPKESFLAFQWELNSAETVS